MTQYSRGLLLDTCAVIWLANGDLAAEAVNRVVYAGLADGIFVSPVSAWEVGMLSAPRGGRPKVEFLPDPLSWFADVMNRPVIKEAPLTASIAINAAFLPGELHGDPADRLLVATARDLKLPILTRDRRILDYGEKGFVAAVEC